MNIINELRYLSVFSFWGYGRFVFGTCVRINIYCAIFYCDINLNMYFTSVLKASRCIYSTYYENERSQFSVSASCFTVSSCLVFGTRTVRHITSLILI